MRFRGHEADITISDVSKSQEDDGRVCRFLSSTRLWCMPCDVCCNPTFKMLFKDFFFLNLPVRCPQAKIPEQLSLPPLLPAVLSFHPLPSVFIFCWKKENRVPSKLPNIHFEIYPLPPPPNPSQIHIYLYFTFFPPCPFPSCPCVAVVHFSLFSDWLCSELWTWRRLNVGVLPLHKSLLSEFGSRPGSLHVTGRNP